MDKVNIKCVCVDGSIVIGRRESLVYHIGLGSPPSFKIFEERTSILSRKVNNDKIGDIVWFSEVDDKNIVHFNGEILTFTVMLIKKSS